MTIYSRILVPLEHSPYDEAILAHVRPLARLCRASLVLLHVADGWAARNIRQLGLQESEEMQRDRAYLEAVCAALTGDGYAADAVLGCGDPAEEIIATAERERCELIAMATHGHRFLADLVYGSVAESVRHRCGIPVLLVRGERRARPRPRGGRRPAGVTPGVAPRGPARRALTAPVEDYLKAVYDLERDGEPAATNDLSARLGVAPASVTGMVRRLAAQGLLAHTPYRGVRLTTAGRRAALTTLRRHRVLEAYLATALGVPPERLHEEAERLEHAASDDLVDRMAAALGDPARDPHGAPIPTRAEVAAAKRV